MWISAKAFMELIDRINHNEQRVRELEHKIEAINSCPIVLEKKSDTGANTENEYNASELINELMNGVPNAETGKVVWTDGRD